MFFFYYFFLLTTTTTTTITATTTTTTTATTNDNLPCSLSEEDKLLLDPNLKEMEYDIGNGLQTTLVYVDPPVSSYYNQNNNNNGQQQQQQEDDDNDDDVAIMKYQKVAPKFNGFQGKFINLSAETVSLYWEDSPNGAMHLMRLHRPFTSSGTATFPGHRFYFTKPNNPNERLHFMLVRDYPENIYYYDPYHVQDDPEQTQLNIQALSSDEQERYNRWKQTLLFNEYYKNFTGRSYLSNYLRHPPKHFMWRADYFNQEHWVTSRETHFISLPDDDEDNNNNNNNELMLPITSKGKQRIISSSDDVLLSQYRDNNNNNTTSDNDNILNMTLKVLSCSPRVFEIKNFLSPVEVNHLLTVANTMNLHLSSTGDGADANTKEEDTRRTRTSYNSWIPREKTRIIDAIYRRAADLQLVDEALLRFRDKDERVDFPTSKRSLAEQLQLVHYEPGQEYTAHHDFGFAHIEQEEQAARFSTLLLYLNDDVKGGETSFPRYVNAETFHKLEVKPEVGKAILFYSQLPDGNMDDFSHHAAEPVLEGEKWLTNLWLWDPVYG